MRSSTNGLPRTQRSSTTTWPTSAPSSDLSAPTPPPPSSSSPAATVRYEDRIFLTGTTSSGKSTLARRLFLSAPAPRLVIDPADSTLTEVPGAVTFSDPSRATNAAGENWRSAATARFVPRDPADLDVYDAVYRWCFAHFPRWIWCDEAGVVLPSSGAPRGATQLLTQGRKRQIGHLACHTRPLWVSRDLISQAAHVIVFSTPSIKDRRFLCENMGAPAEVFEAEHAALPEYGFLWWNQRERHLTVCDPL